MDARWTYGGRCPSTNSCNKRLSEFRTSEVKYCRSCEPQESWLLLERLMMKSSALFERGPLPPYVHLASIRRHSRDRCSQAFPVFRAASVHYTERKPKNKNGGGLGTRLDYSYSVTWPDPTHAGAGNSRLSSRTGAYVVTDFKMGVGWVGKS